jgi:hypothetical protein
MQSSEVAGPVVAMAQWSFPSLQRLLSIGLGIEVWLLLWL